MLNFGSVINYSYKIVSRKVIYRFLEYNSHSVYKFKGTGPFEQTDLVVMCFLVETQQT
jgi:hypothetical protein